MEEIAEERVEVIAEAVSYTPLENALTVADLAKDRLCCLIK
ncbi:MULTISPECIES: hypothetical protein [Vibrio]|nr:MULTISPECIES: hypothetical protein [Vibrio]